MADLDARHQDIIAPVIAFSTKVHAVSAEGLWVTVPKATAGPTSPVAPRSPTLATTIRPSPRQLMPRSTR